MNDQLVEFSLESVDLRRVRDLSLEVHDLIDHLVHFVPCQAEFVENDPVLVVDFVNTGESLEGRVLAFDSVDCVFLVVDLVLEVFVLSVELVRQSAEEHLR